MSGFISQVLYAFSALLFIHSGYSAYEFSQFTKRLPLDSVLRDACLPTDIRLEAFAGVLFTALAAVIGAAGSLRPIKFSKAMELLEAENKNPYKYLETRPVFQDISAQREAFAKAKTTAKRQQGNNL